MAKHAYFHGKRVSLAHASMLREAEQRGILDRINQGRRTLAEQAAFYAAYLRGGTLAARPWGGAPHIKWGRENHALDVNAPHPAQRLATFYRSHGVPVSFNVPGEPWHMDFPDEAKLIRAANKVEGPPTIRRGRNNPNPAVKRLKRWLRKAGYRPITPGPGFGRALERKVKAFQRKKGLKADGIVGPATWRALERVAK